MSSINGFVPMSALPGGQPLAQPLAMPSAVGQLLGSQPAPVPAAAPLGNRFPVRSSLASGFEGAQSLGERPIRLRVTSAVKAALRELGLHKGAVNGTADGELRQSILAFQAKNGLAKTGKLNAATKRALGEQVRDSQDAKRSTQGPASPVRVAGSAQVRPATVPGAIPMQPSGVMPVGHHGAVPVSPAATLPFGMAASGFDPLTGFAGTGMLPTASAGPQVNATNQGGLGTGSAGGTQTVTNRNVFDSDAMSRQPALSPWGAVGGMGSTHPYVGWGSSMTGASWVQPHGGGIGGFFRRLLG